eukprot:3030487-Pleurochrysis_carterae.AAC.1
MRRRCSRGSRARNIRAGASAFAARAQGLQGLVFYESSVHAPVVIFHTVVVVVIVTTVGVATDSTIFIVVVVVVEDARAT